VEIGASPLKGPRLPHVFSLRTQRMLDISPFPLHRNLSSSFYSPFAYFFRKTSPFSPFQQVFLPEVMAILANVVNTFPFSNSVTSSLFLPLFPRRRSEGNTLRMVASGFLFAWTPHQDSARGFLILSIFLLVTAWNPSQFTKDLRFWLFFLWRSFFPI